MRRISLGYWLGKHGKNDGVCAKICSGLFNAWQVSRQYVCADSTVNILIICSCGKFRYSLLHVPLTSFIRSFLAHLRKINFFSIFLISFIVHCGLTAIAKVNQQELGSVRVAYSLVRTMEDVYPPAEGAESFNKN